MADVVVTEKKRELQILLLGKTGTGKSTTGNTILGRDEFVTSGAGKSVTDEIESAWCETDKYTIKVIDGPGLVDTTMTEVKDKERAIKSIGKTLMECDNGVNAFLYVISYAQRFTQEDRQALDNLKQIIGDRMGDYSVVILTRGDEWIDEQKDMNFQNWCVENDKYYNGIFSFCDYRCVLFENRKPSDRLKTTQVNDLLTNVEKIEKDFGFYTNELFKEGASNREKLIVQLKAPHLKVEFQKGVDLLSAEINKIGVMQSNDEKIKGFREVKRKAQCLLIVIEKEDKQSGAFNDLKQNVQKIITAAGKCNEVCLHRLAAEIQTIKRAFRTRQKVLAGVRFVVACGAGAAASAGTIASAGLAFPLLIAAWAVFCGTAGGTFAYQRKKTAEDDRKLTNKLQLLFDKNESS